MYIAIITSFNLLIAKQRALQNNVTIFFKSWATKRQLILIENEDDAIFKGEF